jgi:hypothetical protein
MNSDYLSKKKNSNSLYLSKNEQNIAILGTFIYITVFIIIIPIILYKSGLSTLVKIYFVNTDLLATALSFHKGPFQNIFKYLYNNTEPFIGYFSQNIINLTVLLGLFYIRLEQSKKESISSSLSKISFILLITYLLPGRYIIKLQDDYYNNIGGKLFWNGYDINGIKTLLFGLFIVISLILLENLSIRYLSHHLEKIIDNFFKIII